MQAELSQQPGSSQDSVTSFPRWNDDLAKARQKPEHRGRVVGVGDGVKWDKVFPRNPEGSRRPRRDSQEFMDNLREQMREIAEQTWLRMQVAATQGQQSVLPANQPVGWSSCASTSDGGPYSVNPVDSITVSLVR